MEYNYGTQDVILAGNPILSKGHYERYVYYGDSIEDLIESANSCKRNTDCFGILIGRNENLFSIQVEDIDGLTWIVDAPAIICLKEDVTERYEPFSSKEDFIRSYLDHVPNDGLMSELCGEYLLRPSKVGNNLMMVLAIKDSGLSFIDDKDVSWEGVQSNYRFLDGSTCGKKVRLEEFSMQKDSAETTSDSTNQIKSIDTYTRNPKNPKNDDNVSTDAKLVGGTIFYIDDAADGVYEFFDTDGNPMDNIKVGDKPYSYRVVKKGSKDKYYVYHDELYDDLNWSYYKDSSWVCEPLGTRKYIGSGKTNTETAMTKDNGAYIAADSGGCPTIWYRLQQVRDAKVGGCDDWFIPSRREIEALREAVNLGTVTGGMLAGSEQDESLLLNRYIWSSSAYSAPFSWLWDYRNQRWDYGGKHLGLAVFFTRAF